ncbi:MAG: hypothetical protein KA369_21515 [Spirochaetes bacterium]|nr:hypothetical protein [Spirochaetota bacterium]
MDRQASFFRKYIFRLNLDELLFDIFLIAYAEFFLYRFVTGGKWLVEILSMKTLLLGGVFIDFFIIWYLGIILKEYLGYYKKPLVIVMYGIAALWIVCALHIGIAKNVFDIFGKPDFIVMSVFAYLMVTVGIGGGIVFAGTEVQRGGGTPVAAVRARALKILLPFGMWAMNIYLIYYLLDALRMKYILIGIPLWALFTFLEFYLLWIIEKRLRKGASAEWGPSGADTVFRKFIFPVIAVTLLCLWDEIFLWGSITRALKNGNTPSMGGTLAYLTLAGIVPMRVILVFQPPLSLVNLAIGVGSMGYFLYSVALLIKGFA